MGRFLENGNSQAFSRGKILIALQAKISNAQEILEKEGLQQQLSFLNDLTQDDDHCFFHRALFLSKLCCT